MNRMTKLTSVYSGRYCDGDSLFTRLQDPFVTDYPADPTVEITHISSFPVYGNYYVTYYVKAAGNAISSRVAKINFSTGQLSILPQTFNRFIDSIEGVKSQNADILHVLVRGGNEYYATGYSMDPNVSNQFQYSSSLIQNSGEVVGGRCDNFLNYQTPNTFEGGLLAFGLTMPSWATTSGFTFIPSQVFTNGGSYNFGQGSFDYVGNTIGFIYNDYNTYSFAYIPTTLNSGSLAYINDQSFNDYSLQCIKYMRLTTNEYGYFFLGGNGGQIWRVDGYNSNQATIEYNSYKVFKIAYGYEQVCCFGQSNKYFYAGSADGRLARSSDGRFWRDIPFNHYDANNQLIEKGPIISISMCISGKLVIFTAYNMMFTLDLDNE